ncbi:unnamed protein product [Echinostoma caproni]|uniref:SMAP domain-containing protein n=1 Tax=Echinostoma caproni TaxID=27848 RepID=A0A183AUZ0_9TREM|nr:unnamed protein product [Echinostoma caproni]
MYRSRMPYTRWHAKEDLLKERMKEAMSPRYYRIRSDLTSSDESLATEGDKPSDFCDGINESTVKVSAEDRLDIGPYKRDPIKPIRQQRKECQSANTLRGFGSQSERFRASKQMYVRRLGPGIYDTASALNISKVVKSKGRFDTSSEIRCGPIKTGYLANLVR